MSDFLHNLVARSLGRATLVRPRLAALYEPPGGTEPAPLEHDAAWIAPTPAAPADPAGGRRQTRDTSHETPATLWQAAGGRRQAADTRHETRDTSYPMAGGRRQAAGGRHETRDTRQAMAVGSPQSAIGNRQSAGTRHAAQGTHPPAAIHVGALQTGSTDGRLPFAFSLGTLNIQPTAAPLVVVRAFDEQLRPMVSAETVPQQITGYRDAANVTVEYGQPESLYGAPMAREHAFVASPAGRAPARPAAPPTAALAPSPNPSQLAPKGRGGDDHSAALIDATHQSFVQPSSLHPFVVNLSQHYLHEIGPSPARTTTPGMPRAEEPDSAPVQIFDNRTQTNAGKRGRTPAIRVHPRASASAIPGGEWAPGGAAPAWLRSISIEARAIPAVSGGTPETGGHGLLARKAVTQAAPSLSVGAPEAGGHGLLARKAAALSGPNVSGDTRAVSWAPPTANPATSAQKLAGDGAPFALPPLPGASNGVPSAAGRPSFGFAVLPPTGGLPAADMRRALPATRQPATSDGAPSAIDSLPAAAVGPQFQAYRPLVRLSQCYAGAPKPAPEAQPSEATLADSEPLGCGRSVPAPGGRVQLPLPRQGKKLEGRVVQSGMPHVSDLIVSSSAAPTTTSSDPLLANGDEQEQGDISALLADTQRPAPCPPRLALPAGPARQAEPSEQPDSGLGARIAYQSSLPRQVEPSEQPGAGNAPAIQISIGRIDVCAGTAAPAPARPRPAPPLPLDEYLRQRREGGRR